MTSAIHEHKAKPPCEVVGEYEDAGKSGRSIEGRGVFYPMMEDMEFSIHLF